MCESIRLRDGISKIEQLKPYSFFKKDGVIRYNFFQMNSIIETNLNMNTRGCEKELIKMGFNIPYEESLIEGRPDELKYCDFWHYQLDSVFRTEVTNDSVNTLYVGTKNGIDLKKLKKQPNEWQLMILKEWNKTFYHLADKNGKIKVEIWW